MDEEEEENVYGNGLMDDPEIQTYVQMDGSRGDSGSKSDDER